MIFDISCDQLHMHLVFCLGKYDAKAVRRYANRRKYNEDIFEDLPNHPEVAAGTCWGSPNGAVSLIWMPEAPDDRYTEGILAHEIVHGVTHGMTTLGSTCEELTATLTGWFYTEAMKRVDKGGRAR